ncbi:MAG: ECF transporter S component [Lachnospiraceae bacterium]|nr:ECF transporter S component [Lachnospiraceae bacterium]
MNEKTKKITLSALFIALGLVLPLLTGQLKQLGNAFLPMHLPVLLCGLVVGPVHGLIVGLILPILRHFTFGMPPLYPTGISMAFELATYGFVVGYVYKVSRWKCIIALYESLIIAMVAGRIIWGIVQMILLGINGQAFTYEMFMAGAFLNAIPGIVFQLIFIPSLMLALHKTGMVKIYKKELLKRKV